MDPSISAATVGRLPAYLRAAIELGDAGLMSVSSERLSESASVHPATMRRDLASLDIAGTRGVGYDVKYLISQISLVLGLNQDWPVVVIGAGNLGKALANYRGFPGRGFPIAAIVDTDEAVINTTIAGIAVIGPDGLAEAVGQHGILLGVITTPPESAQFAADLLVANGIQSMLNFTAEVIDAGPEATVRTVDIATELQILSFYRQRSRAARTGTGVPLAP